MRKLSIGDAVLIVLATGVILTSPAGTMALSRNIARELGKQLGKSDVRDNEEQCVRSSLYRLKKRGYIRQKITKSGVGLVLTKKGRERAQSQDTNLSIPKPKTWDGKWRFVIFDIPEKNKDLRDILRARLKEVDFFQVQKSVWVHPYPCDEEVTLLANSLDLQKYVLLFEGVINRPGELKAFFSRKGYPLS